MSHVVQHSLRMSLLQGRNNKAHKYPQAQAISKLNEQEQEYRAFITSAIEKLQAACEALLLDNGNAPTVEDLTMQWKKMRYVGKSAMGSVKAFLIEGIKKIDSKNWIAGKMWDNMAEE